MTRIQARHVQLKNISPNLKKSGVLNNICKFLVSDDKFPLYNISTLLFFSLTQSTCLQLKMPVECDTEKRLSYFGYLGF